MTETDVLIFAEDPGAANCVADLPRVLRERGVSTRVIADGVAVAWLAQRGLSPEKIDRTMPIRNYFANEGPRVLIVGTAEDPDTLGLALILEARACHVPCVGIVDARASASTRFSGRSDRPLSCAPDWLLLPDSWTRDAFTRLGYPADRALVCGNPQHDHVLATRDRLVREDMGRLRARMLPGLGDGRKAIVFATEGSHRVMNSYGPHPPKPSRTEVVLSHFLGAASGLRPKPYLALRLHPKDAVEDYRDFLKEFDHVSAGGSPLELVFAADLLVGLTSMLLREAVLLGRPALSILLDPTERAWLSGGQEGIASCLAGPELLPALERQLHRPEETQPATRQAATSQRIGQFIVELLEKSRRRVMVSSPEPL